MMGLLTPFCSEGSNRRLELRLTDEDSSKIPNRGYWGPVEVFDLDSGSILEVTSADCGAGCHCAAVVTKVIRLGDAPFEYFD